MLDFKELSFQDKELIESYLYSFGEDSCQHSFTQMYLLKDKYPTDMHMIVCRNVLIYFTEEAKEEVFKKFNESLAHNGILFIGSTEQIINYTEIGYARKNSFYYEKP